VRRFEVFVDVHRQQQLRDSFSMPTFPLNTDAVDLQASSAHVHDGIITNFDDAVAFKPCSMCSMLCENGCASGLVENLQITYSLGLTIGSVPPLKEVNCVANVLFRNNSMTKPIKAIYIKTNPGLQGTGIIANISYQDITIREASWWPLWIGPQQMRQPDGTFTGCDFDFPFTINSTCLTNPLISIFNISLLNVISLDAVENPIPGLILCDPQNPCKGISFTNTLFTHKAKQNGNESESESKSDEPFFVQAAYEDSKCEHAVPCPFDERPPI